MDVASYLGFSKPSVSHAVKLLQEDGYLEINPNKYLLLTPKGRQAAEAVYKRHVFFSEMLEKIGVPGTLPRRMPAELNILSVKKPLRRSGISTSLPKKKPISLINQRMEQNLIPDDQNKRVHKTRNPEGFFFA